MHQVSNHRTVPICNICTVMCRSYKYKHISYTYTRLCFFGGGELETIQSQLTTSHHLLCKCQCKTHFPLTLHFVTFNLHHPSILDLLGNDAWKKVTSNLPNKCWWIMKYSPNWSFKGDFTTVKIRQKFTNPLPETNSSPLKMDGWNRIVSFWGPAYFQVRLLFVSASVSPNYLERDADKMPWDAQSEGWKM